MTKAMNNDDELKEECETVREWERGAVSLHAAWANAVGQGFRAVSRVMGGGEVSYQTPLLILRLLFLCFIFSFCVLHTYIGIHKSLGGWESGSLGLGNTNAAIAPRFATDRQTRQPAVIPSPTPNPRSLGLKAIKRPRLVKAGLPPRLQPTNGVALIPLRPCMEAWLRWDFETGRAEGCLKL